MNELRVTKSRIMRNFQVLVILLVVVVSGAVLVLHPASVMLVLALVAGLVFMFERPDLTIWALVIATPLETFGPVTFLMTKSAKLALASVAAAILYWNSTSRRLGDADPYRWPLLLIVTSGFFSTLLARSPWSSLTGLASILIFVLLYQSVRMSGLLVRKGRDVLQVVMWLGSLCSLLCLAQSLFGYDGLLGSPEQRAMQAEGVVDTFWPGIERGSATMNGPSVAGAFCAIGGVIALTRALVFRRSRFPMIGVALFCAGGVLATFSRGALLGLLAGCGFACWAMEFLSKKRLWLIGAVATPLIIVSVAAEDVRNYLRLGSDLVSVSESCVDAWQATRTILARHPVFGIGFYEFREFAQGIEGVSDTPLHPHNGFLKALVEEGPIGGLGYLLYVASFLKTASRGTRQSADESLRWLHGTIAGVGVSLFTQEVFDANLTIGGSSIAILFAILLAVQVPGLGIGCKTPSVAGHLALQT